MQKKNENNLDNLIEKFVKKDYNNELESVLEKKAFQENSKSILLSILYKIETSYKDYKKVKQNVDTKEEIIKRIINEVEENCNNIKLVRPNSEESEILKNKTFLIEKKRKTIICYNIERKVLYCISKISKNDKILPNKYFLLNETMSDMINTGNNINDVEPLRDFNGYSWTTITKEIESVNHNLIYQNLILLVGNEFMEDWINNKNVMIDYYEKFKNNLTQLYGKELTDELIKLLERLSVLMEIKYSPSSLKRYQNLKIDLDSKLAKMQNNEAFVENITKEKRAISKEIKEIDEKLNDKDLLEKEYVKRNSELSSKEKIFSLNVLKKILKEEREQKMFELNRLNELLKPKQYVKIKRQIELKEEYLKLIEVDDCEKEINKLKCEIQKVFMKCFEKKLENVNSKAEMTKLIYEFRYYSMLPYDYSKNIYETQILKNDYHNLELKVLDKAHKTKVIEKLSNQTDIDYQLLRYLFRNRAINLEEIQVKLVKVKDKNNKKLANYKIQFYIDNNIVEESELKNPESLVYKDLTLRYNKKVDIFY